MPSAEQRRRRRSARCCRRSRPARSAPGTSTTRASSAPTIRTSPISDPANGGASVPVSRANPLHWAAILYNPNVAITETLAYPARRLPGNRRCVLPDLHLLPAGQRGRPGQQRQALRRGRVPGSAVRQGHQGQRRQSDQRIHLRGTTAADPGRSRPVQHRAAVAGVGQCDRQHSTCTDSAQASGGSTLGAQNLWIQDGFPTTAPDVRQRRQPGRPEQQPELRRHQGRVIGRSS